MCFDALPVSMCIYHTPTMLLAPNIGYWGQRHSEVPRGCCGSNPGPLAEQPALQPQDEFYLSVLVLRGGVHNEEVTEKGKQAVLI